MTEDKALLWRFRWSLTPEKRALTKFLQCVDWGDAQEARQAAELMHHWAPIDIADALELLSPDFTNEEVHPELQPFPTFLLAIVAHLAGPLNECHASFISLCGQALATHHSLPVFIPPQGPIA